eukprot:6249015-Alexandrium_andersonii.AAC.1
MSASSQLWPKGHLEPQSSQPATVLSCPAVLCDLADFPVRSAMRAGALQSPRGCYPKRMCRGERRSRGDRLVPQSLA